MPHSLAILQSNYIPWKGYFDIIASVDRFMFFDDRQFTTADWRNRNQIVTHQGVQWLTVPCGSKRSRLICEVAPSDSKWQKKHWNALTRAYGKAEFFAGYKAFFEEFYLGREWTNLSELNQFLIKQIAGEFLGLTTEFDDSRNHPVEGEKADRIMALIRSVGGVTEYVSGPSARDYLDPAAFAQEGVQLTWMDYAGYPEYRQQHEPFVHEVTVLDLLFREGPRAREFMKCGSGG